MISDYEKPLGISFEDAIAEIESLPIAVNYRTARVIAAKAARNNVSAMQVIQDQLEAWGYEQWAMCEDIVASLDEDETPQDHSKIKERRLMTPSLRLAVFQRDNHTCKSCGATEKDSKLHVDHILPISKGGKTTLDNLQTLCEPCNLAKASNVIMLGARR